MMDHPLRPLTEGYSLGVVEEAAVPEAVRAHSGILTTDHPYGPFA